MFRLMNLRMRILSSPPPSFVAAAVVGVVEGRRGAHITLHLPSLVDESSLQSSNGKNSKYDFLCQDLLGIYDLGCVLLCVILLFCSASCGLYESAIRVSITNTYSITRSIHMLIKSVSCYSSTSFCNLAKKIWFANLCFQINKVIISIIKFNGNKFKISGKRSPAFVFGLVKPYFRYQPKPTTTCFSCGGWNYRYM